jgi:hypothetical protein
MNKYAILQSGFISNINKHLVNNQYIKDPFVDLALDKDHLKSKSEYFYNKNINEIYTEWSKNTSLIKDMEFRENIIKLAKEAFNNISMYDWLNIQSNANTVTSLHYNFIIETLDFISGTPRTIQTSQWIRLLEVSKKAESIYIDIDKYFKKEGRVTKTTPLPGVLSDFIVSWLSRPNGFEDMLISLYVIFGDRPYVTDVANKNIL